ncbi:MAG: hypothetical protein ACK452_16230, partial [Bacteroidota bacterium]
MTSLLFYSGLHPKKNKSDVFFQIQYYSLFHLFDDSKEWFQVDKFGHAYTCYQLGEIGINSLKWAGIKEEKAIWLG